MLQRSAIITIVILKDFLFNGINKKLEFILFIFFAAECMHERTISGRQDNETGIEMRLFFTIS